MMTAEERYTQDPHFHALVDTLRALVDRGRFTPTALRQALGLVLAHREAPMIKCCLETHPSTAAVAADAVA